MSMGGTSSTIHFEGPPGGLGSYRLPQGPPDKREEGALLGGAPPSLGCRGPVGLWQAQDGDKTLDAVLHMLRLLGGGDTLLGGPHQPHSGCLLQHHQLLLAWKMSRRGPPGRCGCCETLLPLGGPLIRVAEGPEKALRRPQGNNNNSSSSTSAAGDITPRRGARGGGPGWAPPSGEAWRRVPGTGALQPDPISCYLIVHAYTTAQQQQQQQVISHTPEGPRERRRSVTPPGERLGGPLGPPEGPTADAEGSPHRRGLRFPITPRSSSSSSSRIAAKLVSGDLLRLLLQAETFIAGDTRRHSVWHSVQPCCCCCCSSSNQQQQQQQDRRETDTRSSMGSTPGPPRDETETAVSHQQLQLQHLWAVYLWEGVKAPRYILVSYWSPRGPPGPPLFL